MMQYIFLIGIVGAVVCSLILGFIIGTNAAIRWVLFKAGRYENAGIMTVSPNEMRHQALRFISFPLAEKISYFF